MTMKSLPLNASLVVASAFLSPRKTGRKSKGSRG